MEKLEFLYISPYYLQAAFFLIGTFCWLLAETVFRARLPFWTSLWGWSLVLTNFFALPLVNAVGLFLEEAEEKDYLGLLSFVALSYLLVPFQAYASVKGFLEKQEGPWFRTPKTGLITDIFTRGKFYRWIAGILPGRQPAPQPAHSSPYLALATANNQFANFFIPSKKTRWLGRAFLAVLLVFSTVFWSLSSTVPYFFNQDNHSFGVINGPADDSFKQTELPKRNPRQDFRVNEEPKFIFDFTSFQKERGGLNKHFLISLVKTAEAVQEKTDDLQAFLLDSSGSKLNVDLQVSQEDGGQVKVRVPSFSGFRPGAYKLKVEIEREGRIITEERDFTWGVLAINTNKAIYLPGDRVYLQMAALKEDGHTLCEANLRLEIRNPKSQMTNLSTEEGTIQQSGKCGPDNVTDTPDYFAYLKMDEVGIYELKLVNLSNGYSITDSFEVREKVDFDVERIGPTRIYPAAPYQMKLKIKANQNFKGEVRELISNTFEILNLESVQGASEENGKKLSWQVDWQKGKSYELIYQFDAPDISPYLYLLGPLRLVDTRSGQALFEESRQWQIAADSGVTDAMMIYDTQTITSTPKYRQWTGSWGSEANANTVNGEIRHQVLKFCPTRDEAILAILSSTGELQVQVWNGSSWGAVSTLVTMADTTGSRDIQSLYRGFDLDYETTSGDAIIVYGDGTADPNFDVWNGSGWVGATNIDVPTTGIPNWIELASRPGSDELAMIILDSNVDVYGMRWTGSAWDNMGTATAWETTASIATRKAIDVAFENTSGEIMFAWGFATVATAHFRYRAYTGTLGSVTNITNANNGGVVSWLKLAPNPTSSSNQIMIGLLDAGADLNTFIWSGSAWSAVHAEHSGTTEDIVDMNFDIIFETHSSNPNDAWLLWGDSATVSRKLWDGGTSAWGTATTSGDDTANIQLTAQPVSGAVLAAVYEDDTSASDDITQINQTGGVQTWSSPSIIWTGPVARNLGFSRVDIASERYNSSTDAMMVYDTQTITSTPKYRRWTSSWQAEASANTVNGEIRHQILKFCPTRNEAILAVLSSTGKIQVQVWSGSSWGSVTTLETWDQSGDLYSLYRSFDLEYETTSGDAVIVFNDNNTADPDYYVWNGLTWTGPTDINLPTTGVPYWIELAADPVSDELAMILLDANSDVYGMYWNGSAWDDMNAGGTEPVWDATVAVATRKAIDVAFEKTSGDILWVWADDVPGGFFYRTYDGSLSSATRLGIDTIGGLGNWLKLASNPTAGSNQIMLGVLDAGSDLNTRVWSGTAWDTPSAATPKYRQWTGSWGVEGSANTVNGEIRHQVLKFCPTRDEAILAILSSTGELQVQVWNGSTWGAVSTLGTLANPTYRGFDLDYETTSGDAIIVYNDGTADPNYRVWNGSGWSDPAVDIDVPTTGTPNWIELASDPTSDELAMILLDTNTDVYGMRWTGSAWDNMGDSAVWDATASIATRKAIDVAFENTSGEIMFAWGFTTVATAHFRYRAYTGTLGSATNVTNANNGGVVHWLKLAPNPTSSSNQIMIGLLDAGSDLNTFLWDGLTWSAVHTEHSAGTEDIVDMNFDLIFETHSLNPNDAWLVWGDGGTVSRKLWDGGTSTWGTATTSGDDTAQITLSAQPVSGAVLAATYQDDTSSADDIREMSLTSGSQTWSTPTIIWSGPVKTNMTYSFIDIASEKYNSSNNAMMVYDTNTTNTSHAEHDDATEDIVDMNFDLVFETHSSNPNDAWLVWADDATVSRKLWDGGASSWQAATTSGDDTANVQLAVQPNSGAVLSVIYEDDTSATDDITEINLTSGSQTWNSPTIVWSGPVARNLNLFRVDIAAERFVFSTAAAATGYSFQRKTWYDGARMWKAYYDGSQIVFDYSADYGNTWIRNTSATLSVFTNDFSIEADSSNCFIVYTSSNDTRGQKASSYPGTGFSWGSEETILNGSGATNDYNYPVIKKDSSDYVWVAARYTGSSIYYIKAIKETGGTNDLPEDTGDTVYSISDTSNSSANVYGTLSPLASGDIYASWVRNTTIEGCRWDDDHGGGARWENSSDQACPAYTDSIDTGSTGLTKNMSAVVDTTNNYVHLVYTDSNNNLVYKKYNGSSWDADHTDLDANATCEYATISVNTATNDLYALWIRSSHIYYKKATYSAGPTWTWDVTVSDWKTTTAGTSVTSNYAGEGMIFAEWTSGSSSPYTVNWSYIIIPEQIWLFLGLGLLIPKWLRKTHFRRKKCDKEGN